MAYEKDLLYIRLSNAAYGDRPVPDGWQVIASENNKKTGFQAVAYKNSETDVVVIAYAGSNDRKDWMNPNPAAAGIKKWDNQFTEGLAFADKVIKAHPDSVIETTGHSLGGGHAQLVAQMYGLNGITFDPAATKNLAYSGQFRDWAQTHGLPVEAKLSGKGVPASFTNYAVNGSIVSHGTGSHLGRVEAVSGLAQRSWQDMLKMPTPVSETIIRHDRDRIQRVFEKAVHDGVLQKFGHHDASPEQTYASLHKLHDRIGETVLPQHPMSADAHLNLTMYTTSKMAKDGIAMHEMGDMRYQEFNGKQLLLVQNTEESKFTTADINKAIAVPAEQTLTAMQQPAQTQQHAQRAMHV